MVKPSFAAPPRGHYDQLKSSKTGPRPPRGDQVERDTMVTPLARGLAVLAAFGPKYVWVGNKQIALETGLPAPTVSRLLASLVTFGYVRYDKSRRKYRLTSATLNLGYAAIVDGDIQHVASNEMRKFAESTQTYVQLGTRDRLDVVVVDSYLGSQAMLALDMTPGARMSLDGSIAGIALLSALPERERDYLLHILEHRAGQGWPDRRRRITKKIAQMHELGFCTSPGEWVPDITSVSTLIHIPDRPPRVLSCTGRTSRLPRMRLEREIGPLLVATAQLIQEKIAALPH